MSDRGIAAFPDRRYLTESILPAFGAARLPRVVFVGCKPYTKPYSKFFRDGGTEYWTLDYDDTAAPWGEKGRHITEDVRFIDRHFGEGTVDAALLNGVFGWGLNDVPGMNTAITAMARIIRPGGYLMVGWNMGRIPDPMQLAGIAGRFRQQGVLGLPARKTFEGSEFNHVYDFLVRLEP